VIITTAAGKLQDLSHSSLDPGVTLWLSYAGASVAISGILLALTWTRIGQKLLPAARLAQVAPADLSDEIDLLWEDLEEKKSPNLSRKYKESILKSPRHEGWPYIWWLYLVGAAGVVLIGWIMFALGVEWGVHGDVIAGTVGE
jgi:hypothetical protein